MKLLLILLFPIFIYANFSYTSNYNKELKLLESFDIQPSFLYDPIMNNIRIKNSSLGKDKFFFKAMKDASLFIPAIKKILAQKNLPQEFLFLAMAESNFSTKAYSKKKAAGLWQFMPETASIYGLTIDRYIDERRDVIKSTKAAATHLLGLHNTFGKWYLAIIAYNCGDGRLIRAIDKAHSDELSVLLDEEKKFLPKETRNYLRKVIALALIGHDEEFLLSSKQDHLLNIANAQSISTVKLSAGETLSRVAKIIDMPIENLKNLNRHLKYSFIPPFLNNYDVYIPYEKLSVFKKKYVKELSKKSYKIHVVTAGDNLGYIGKVYGIPYQVIVDFNKLKSTKLHLKQKLVIPIEKYKDKV